MLKCKEYIQLCSANINWSKKTQHNFKMWPTNVRDLSYAVYMKMSVMAIPSLQYQFCQKMLSRSQSHSLFSNKNRREIREATINTKHTGLNLYKCNAGALDLFILFTLRFFA